MNYDQSGTDYVNDGVVADGAIIGAPAVRLTNNESGRIFGGVRFAAGGSIFVNVTGGIVRVADGDTPMTTVVSGSEGADAVTNGGRITGGVFLRGGSDAFTWTRGGSVAGLVDLGDGDDLFRADDPNASGMIAGGAGYDRYELVGGSTSFLTATGFEALHFSGSGVASGVSGLLAVTYATGVQATFERSYSPSAIVTLNGGEFQLGVDGVVGLINGSAATDRLRLSLRSGFDTALLGAGDDQLSTAARTLSRQAGSPVGTVADGGEGFDRIFLGVADGTPDVIERYDVDLSRFRNFETLSFDSGFVQPNRPATTGDIVIVGALAAQRFASLETGGLNRVEIAAGNDPASFGAALVTVGDRATLVIGGDAARRAAVGSVTTITAGDFGAVADDTRSVSVINQGDVLGRVQLGTGDDLYDGRAGGRNGTAGIFGYAGNDRIWTAGGADLLDGGAGGDDLRGFGGADRLFGGSGADTLAGGSGDDVLDGGADVDEAVFGGALALSRFEFPAGGGIVVTGADGRDTVTGVERLRFADRAVDVTVAAPVAVLYAVFGGREATAAERDYWTGELSAGRTTVAGVKAAILADPLGQANTAAVVSGLYRAYLGREPGGAELAYWDGQVRGGTEFAGVRAAIVADPAGPAFVAGAIGRLYRDYGGRDASSDEVGYWTEQVRGGASFADVRGAILADSLGQGHAAAVIGSLYAEYLGRPAGASDIAYWSAEVRGGLEFAGVRAGLVNDASGRAHTAAVVAELYRDYGGREAGAGELAFWDGQVRGGASFADVRGAILADSLGQGHAAAVIGSLYAEHLGRPAGASDIAYWSAEVRGGLDFAGVRAGLVNDASGRAHTAAVVAELYRDYGGREAGAGELAFWDGQVRGGASFADVRGAILADSLGRSYTTAALDGLYAELFGRGAGASDQAAWAGLFRAGADLDTARAALMTDAGSAGRVTQAAGSGAADRFVFVATDRHLAVSGFDPAADVLDLRGSGFTSYAAREVRNLDGRTDVLVTLDATHDVLLRGVALSQLGTDDVLI